MRHSNWVLATRIGPFQESAGRSKGLQVGRGHDSTLMPAEVGRNGACLSQEVVETPLTHLSRRGQLPFGCGPRTDRPIHRKRVHGHRPFSLQSRRVVAAPGCTPRPTSWPPHSSALRKCFSTKPAIGRNAVAQRSMTSLCIGTSPITHWWFRRATWFSPKWGCSCTSTMCRPTADRPVWFRSASIWTEDTSTATAGRYPTTDLSAFCPI